MDGLSRLSRALAVRFSDAPSAAALTKTLSSLSDASVATLETMAHRGSHRRFLDKPIDEDLIQLLAALALSAPSKSDLQQRDIILISDPALRQSMNSLVVDQPWVAGAPVLLVICGDNHRQRAVHRWQDIIFANDHLDAFFNAAVDGAIAMGAFVTAAEALGLGCCPISGLRNRAQEVSGLLNLPDHVFPIAGLALGWPAEATTVSMRLPLALTFHKDGYDAASLKEKIEDYDRARAIAQPCDQQRYSEHFGIIEDYGWMEDKARQYAKPERADFGAFIRTKGFDLT